MLYYIGNWFDILNIGTVKDCPYNLNMYTYSLFDIAFFWSAVTLSKVASISAKFCFCVSNHKPQHRLCLQYEDIHKGTSSGLHSSIQARNMGVEEGEGDIDENNFCKRSYIVLHIFNFLVNAPLSVILVSSSNHIYS